MWFQQFSKKQEKYIKNDDIFISKSIKEILVRNRTIDSFYGPAVAYRELIFKKTAPHVLNILTPQYKFHNQWAHRDIWY